MSLLAFFVYAPRFGNREDNEDQKLLYFYPPDTQYDERHLFIGFCQACVAFTKTFSETPCEAVHQQNKRLALYEAEPDTWMVLVVKNPTSTRTDKDGKKTTMVHEHEVKDDVLQALLRQAYALFRLFNGTFESVINSFSVKTLRDKMELFFPRYVEKLDIGASNCFDTLDGIQFLPVDKETYLLIQCFVNLTENGFSKQIKHIAFLYEDHLVWSGLEQDDMRSLYRYVVSHMESQELKLAGKNATSGQFVTGPSNSDDEDSPVNAPQVHIGNGTEEARLIIYQQGRVTVLLLIDPEYLTDMGFFAELKSSMAPAIQNLSTVVDRKFSLRVASGEDNYKFLYFNHMNLALKTSLKSRVAGPTHSLIISNELSQLLSDLHADLGNPHHQVSLN